jgi:hypothetical protein
MQKSPYSEVVHRSADQEITRFLRKPYIHYGVHKRQQIDIIFNQTDPVRTFIFYFQKINFNIILPYTLVFPELTSI